MHLSDDLCQYFFDVIGETVAARTESPKDRLLRLRQIFENLLKELTRNVQLESPTAFTRAVYVFNELHVPPNIQTDAHVFRKTANLCVHEMSFVTTEAHVKHGTRAILQLISFISGKPVPAQLVQQLSGSVTAAQPIQTALSLTDVSWMRGVVIEAGVEGAQNRRILCSVESPIGLDQITIELTNGWQDVPLRPYATVAVSAIHATSANLYTTTSGSVVVVEPDILIDATTIANCFLQNGTNPLIHLANRFQDSTVNEAMVKGNIVGLIFGYLLRDTEASFDASYERATKQNATALTLLGSSRDMALRNDVLRHFTTLQREVRKLGMGRIHVEATFFSSLYGINGRLDALIDSPQPKQKQIIELKSGRAVTAPLTQYVDGVPVQSRVWSSNLAQAACYYLLMQSTDPELKVTQNILYSADAISPLRPVDVSPKLQRSIVRLRNRIAQIEWTLASGDAAPLRQMKQASLLDAPPFISSDVGVLERALASASPSERAYFEAYCLLIAREHMTARVGGTNPDSAVNGFASLWLNDLHSKEDGYSAIPFLVYDRFDRETKTAIFHPDPKHEMSPSSMREGDIVLLYKHSSDWTAEPLQQQIVRGALRKINATTVEIEIRSGDKQLDTRGYWAVESDLFESGFTAQYRSMARFMRAEPARRSLLLGQTRPRTAPCAFAMTTADLDNHQRDVLKMALEAQDYFLLQGPPGTGKTQKMLRSMLELLYKNTNQKILLLAYTNRAVVEICTVLESMKGIEFLKLGSADGLTNRLSCLEEFSRDKSVAETRQKIDSTRVFVSTISTALNRTELLAYKQFDIALVDEASQLLEPHLAGLLTLVRRFILIGDEKQLPAVITQPVEQTAVSDPSLLALGINDLRLSLFERLLQVCQQKGWSHAYAMLETQGRMHEKIQAFPSTRFYDGRLHTMKPEQTSSQQRFSPTSRDAVERVIATARVLFIPSKQETHAHTHIEEAANVAALLRTIYRVYGKDFRGDSTVGVITPFRAQISEIRSKLSTELQHARITIDTVERYQGSQRDIIIMSMALNHPSQMATIQSLNLAGNVDRKLNVAITRARKHLILLGVPDVLRSQPIYADLLQYIQDQGGLVSAFSSSLAA